MTVATEIDRSGPYAGAGTTGPFPVQFRILDATHLQVIKRTSTGETTLVYATDYSVAGVGNPTCSVTLVAVLPFGETLTIIRDVPKTQEADYVQNDDFPAESHENALDKLTMITQQLGEEQSRALTLPASSAGGVSTELPEPEANKLIGWNPTADALQNMDAATLATIVAFGTANADLFSGDGILTAFNLTDNPGAQANLDVIVGGIGQRAGIDYTWSAGTVVTFTTPPPLGTNNVQVRYFRGLPQGYTTDDQVGVLQPFAGAVNRTQHDKNAEHISVSDFGAVCDGSTDDTAAIQRALDYAVAPPSGLTPILEVPGFCRITPGTLCIDRPVGTAVSELRIVGTGKLAGFYATTAGDYFTSSIAHTTSPVSEWVTFENIHFENGDWNNQAHAVDGDKFLRIKFDKCYFLRVAMASSSNYLQTYGLHMCQVRQWKDWFADAKNLYDVHCHQTAFEQASAQPGRGFSSFDPALGVGSTGAAGCSFTSNLFEDCGGPFVSLQQASGVLIAGNYFEYNTEPNIDLTQGVTQGVTVTGNASFLTPANVANVNFYDVKVGTCRGLFGSGNYCDGRLYDFQSSTAWASIGQGDRSVAGLYRGTPSHVMSETATQIRFTATQVQSADPNTLDDYEENDAFVAVVSGQTNCSAVSFSKYEETKIGRQVTVVASGSMTVTAATVYTGFAFTLRTNQAANDSPGTGVARLVFDGVGGVGDNSAGNPSTAFVFFAANQVPTNGVKTFTLQYTYNAAT